MLAAARAYTRRGWRVVPVRLGEKGVTLHGWQHLRLGEGDLYHWFGWFPRPSARDREELHNVGLLTGEPSGGLVDVDCDSDEARRAAVELLPATGMVSGRAGSPASHYWYRVVGELPATTKYADAAVVTPSPPDPLPSWEGGPDVAQPDVAFGQDAGAGAASGSPPRVGEGPGERVSPDHHRSMLVEFRSTGCQTVAPPSIHPSGEVIRWEHAGNRGSDVPGEPGEVVAGTLLAAVARVASVALLARHWPGEGQRDEAAKDLAGMLLRAGWDAQETDRVVTLVARLAGDEEWRKRAKAKRTAEKLAADGRVTGARDVAGRLRDGERVVAQVCRWLRLPPSCGWPASARLGSAYIAEGGHVSEGAQSSHMAIFVDDGHLRESGSVGSAGSAGSVGSIGQILGEISPTPVRPLWGGRLYQGKLTICDGDPGHGKTLLALDLAARITTGREMPDGSSGIDPAGVVYFTAEDDPADTLRPRLDAAGGDPDRLLVVTTVPLTGPDGAIREYQPTFRDLEVIERAIARVDAKLVIFDPFMAYLDAQTNSFRDQDVRGVLAPLARLAERTDAVFLLIRHLNKSGGGHALYRGGGSIGIIGAARSGLLVGRDPDDPERRVVASTKNNLGVAPGALVYRIVPSPTGAPVIQWEGESPHDARALLQVEESSQDKSAEERACEFLCEALADGPQPQRVIVARAGARGIKPHTLTRAKKRLGVASDKSAFDGGWEWSLSGDNAPTERTDEEMGLPKMANAPEDGPVTGMGAFVEVGHLRMQTSAETPRCPMTGGLHEYALMRDAQGHPVCVACGYVDRAALNQTNDDGGAGKGARG